MSIVTIFSGEFCHADDVVRMILDKAGARSVTDNDVVAEASRLSGLKSESLSRAFTSRTSVFNKFTHEKERSLAWLKLALAGLLQADDLLVHGFSSMLVPQGIENVLRVCLIADMDYRVKQAMAQKGLSAKDAQSFLHQQDQERMAWAEAVRKGKDPWKADLYDMVLPTDKKDPANAANMIVEYLGKDVVKTTPAARGQLKDFLLAARVEVELAKEGHAMEAVARDGMVTVVINKNVLLLSRLEEELKSIAGRVDGVKSVETKVGKDFYQTDIYRRFDFEAPSKVLLVDDEREFVETLSERLIMRDMGSAVVYDGQSALDMVREDEPEVMILDLKMPGIDGIEVLRRVKQTNPDIEVIILTGHGSEADRKVCMDLGAFAYLHKPVDIELLSETLRKANESMRAKREAKAGK